jgi:eukaryotic-like serine/threonine-protein kinase
MIGKTFGHYHILEKIGEGGMGEVYLADDTSLHRKVALKFLPPEMQRDPSAHQRFMREARSAAALDHPYICHINEVGEAEDKNFIVMEYVDGQTLKDRLAQGPLSLKEAQQIGTEILEALEKAHEKGIIHRDLKPANVMLTREGHAKVMDFGLAKQLISASATMSQEETITAVTQSGSISGTPAYMSPEQMQGRPVDAPSDIFSFGIVLYEMLTGVHPFKRPSAIETASAILTGTPPPLDRYRGGIPGQLQGIVRKLLAKDPLQRYQSSHEVRADISRIMLDGQAGTTGRRRFRGIRVAAALIVLAFGVIPLSWWVRENYFKSPRVALAFQERDWILITDFENLTGDSVFDKSLATALNASLSQSTYANIFSKSRANGVLQRMGKKPGTALDEQIGREICQRENIRGLVCPNIGKVGNRFVLTAKIVNPQTGDEVRSYVEQAGDYSQVLAALDKIAGSLRTDLGESLPQIRARSRPLPQVTTPSLSALKSFSDGLQLWDKGQFNSALDLLLTATKDDPDFAMAHAGLGRCYSTYIFNDFTNGRIHYEKALKLVDRLTEREKQIVRLQYESDFGKFETARNLYEIFLQDYPDSIVQRYNYGNQLRDHNMVDKAIEQYKEVLRIAPDYAAAYINLATCYDKIDRPKDALESYDRAFKLQPEWLMDGNQNREYGLVFVRLGDIAKAREIYTKILSTEARPLALRSIALLDLYEGKYRDAKQKLEAALPLNVSERAFVNESRNHLFMSILLEDKMDPAGAMRELDKAAKCLETTPPQVWLSSRIGIGYARGKATDKATKTLDRVRKNANPNDDSQNSSLHRLEGELLLARGDRARAIELLLLADREQGSALTVESLARAYQATGNINEAIAHYETLIGMGGQVLGWEPQQSWLSAHVILAKLYMERKENEKAHRILEKFLALWNSADPDLPILKEAKEKHKILNATTFK